MVSTSWNKPMLLLMLIDLIPIARLMCLLGIWVLLDNEQTWKGVNLSVGSAEAQTIRGVGHVASIAIQIGNTGEAAWVAGDVGVGCRMDRGGSARCDALPVRQRVEFMQTVRLQALHVNVTTQGTTVRLGARRLADETSQWFGPSVLLKLLPTD